MSTPAIETRDLVRTYRLKRTSRQSEAVTIAALDGITLDVPRGELFGLLGPNGAGKTTLIKVLATLLLPTSGTARVAGIDVVTHAQQVRERISMVSGGEHSGYGLLTVREQLWMFSQFYGLPSRVALTRIDELLKIVGLYEERNRRVSALSTGMRQKMNMVRGLVPDPEVLFLDEPTVGLVLPRRATSVRTSRCGSTRPRTVPSCSRRITCTRPRNSATASRSFTKAGSWSAIHRRPCAGAQRGVVTSC